MLVNTNSFHFFYEESVKCSAYDFDFFFLISLGKSFLRLTKLENILNEINWRTRHSHVWGILWRCAKYLKIFTQDSWNRKKILAVREDENIWRKPSAILSMKLLNKREVEKNNLYNFIYILFTREVFFVRHTLELNSKNFLLNCNSLDDKLTIQFYIQFRGYCWSFNAKVANDCFTVSFRVHTWRWSYFKS